MHFIMRDLKKKFKMSDWTEKENLFFLHNIDLYWQFDSIVISLEINFKNRFIILRFQVQ